MPLSVSVLACDDSGGNLSLVATEIKEFLYIAYPR